MATAATGAGVEAVGVGVGDVAGDVAVEVDVDVVGACPEPPPPQPASRDIRMDATKKVGMRFMSWTVDGKEGDGV